MAADNATLTATHSSPSAAPGHTEPPLGQDEPAKAGTQSRLCVCKGKVSFGEKMGESSTTGAVLWLLFTWRW